MCSAVPAWSCRNLDLPERGKTPRVENRRARRSRGPVRPLISTACHFSCSGYLGAKRRQTPAPCRLVQNWPMCAKQRARGRGRRSRKVKKPNRLANTGPNGEQRQKKARPLIRCIDGAKVAATPPGSRAKPITNVPVREVTVVASVLIAPSEKTSGGLRAEVFTTDALTATDLRADVRHADADWPVHSAHVPRRILQPESYRLPVGPDHG